MQAKKQPEYPRLYSIHGFFYCDLLVGEAQRAAWHIVVGRCLPDEKQTESPIRADLLKACDEVAGRAAQTLEWISPTESLVDIALDHLTLGRATLFGALLDQVADAPPRLAECREHLDDAVDGLRKAGFQDYLPRGLLTRALLRQIEANKSGAREDL